MWAWSAFASSKTRQFESVDGGLIRGQQNLTAETKSCSPEKRDEYGVKQNPNRYGYLPE